MELAGDKAFKTFTIPQSMLGHEWSDSEFTDADRKFSMTSITTKQALKAGDLVGAKMRFATMNHEQQMMCLYLIGGKKVFRNRDFRSKWMDAIGAIGRQCVEACWMKMNTGLDSDMEAVFESGESGRG